MKYFILTIACALSLIANGQKDIDTTFTLDNESGLKEVAVNVSSGADALSIVFEGEISAGTIEIELVDPSGKRQGGFELDASSNDVTTIVSGSHEDRDKNSDKDKNTNKNSNTQTTTTTTTRSSSGDEETVISVTSGGNTTSISSGKNSVEINSGSQGMSISSDGGVSIVKSNYTTGESNGAKGVMVESIDEPRSGRWVIKMNCEGVTGEVDLVISHD